MPGPTTQAMNRSHCHYKRGSAVKINETGIELDDTTPVMAWTLLRSSPRGHARKGTAPVMGQSWADVKRNGVTVTSVGFHTLVLVAQQAGGGTTVHRSEPFCVV
jgi:hypothetical protein